MNSLRFSESKDGFDDEIMQAFIAEKEVIEFSEHFFVHDKIPYLTVILSYRDMDRDRRKIISREDPRKELDDMEKEAYDALRAWRSQRARQEGIPPYMIANNKQLAGMIKKRIMSKSGLAGIMGFWDSAIRIEEYPRDNLNLDIKKDALLLAPVFQGLPFLRFRIFPGVVHVSRQGWRRFRRKDTLPVLCTDHSPGHVPKHVGQINICLAAAGRL